MIIAINRPLLWRKRREKWLRGRCVPPAAIFRTIFPSPIGEKLGEGSIYHTYESLSLEKEKKHARQNR
jgi:hypothetical protein